MQEVILPLRVLSLSGKVEVKSRPLEEEECPLPSGEKRQSQPSGQRWGVRSWRQTAAPASRMPCLGCRLGTSVTLTCNYEIAQLK